MANSNPQTPTRSLRSELRAGSDDWCRRGGIRPLTAYSLRSRTQQVGKIGSTRAGDSAQYDTCWGTAGDPTLRHVRALVTPGSRRRMLHMGEYVWNDASKLLAEEG